MEFKFYILPELVHGPYGGGNQFAKALKNHFVSRGMYGDSLEKSNVVIINGFPFKDLSIFSKIFRWKLNAPDRIIISRIDGPISKIRHSKDSDKFDKSIFEFCNIASDGVIIQSNWSLQQTIKHSAFNNNCPVEVIGNSCNPTYFFKKKIMNRKKKKISLIATSWSTNPHKGFSTYKWLDSMINFNKIDFRIISDTSFKYNNIKVFKTVNQKKLGDILRESDIYISCSRVESCSNSVLEALHCGLPVITPNSSSHPEFNPFKELLYTNKNHLLEIINALPKKINTYNKINFDLETIEQISNKYIRFTKQISIKPLKKIYIKDIGKFLKQNNLTENKLIKYKSLLKHFIQNKILK